jgi:hypothetical protein
MIRILHIQISNVYVSVVSGPLSQDAVIKCVYISPGLQCVHGPPVEYSVLSIQWRRSVARDDTSCMIYTMQILTLLKSFRYLSNICTIKFQCVKLTPKVCTYR